MSQRRIQILQLLEEGKVTADEATLLLKAPLTNVATPAITAPGSQSTSGDAQGAAKFRLGDWLQQLIAVTVKQKVEEAFDWTLDRAGIETLAVQTINGAVTYTGAAQNEITIHAHKVVKAPDQASAEAFARQVEIRIEPQAGVLRIYADYPRPPRNVEVQVTFAIHGPRAINITAQSTNGHVAVTGVEGEVHAQSTNGEVQLQDVAGWIEGKSTNGNVHAEQLTLTAASHFTSQNGALVINVQQGQTPLTATTVNGSIRLTLPANYAGQIDARTHNGCIRSDFPTRATEQARNRLVGALGAGGEALLKLRSQNGNVTLTPLAL
jgi:hypothetical protein